jgi:DNA-binding Lrp family transcriptional regulator
MVLRRKADSIDAAILRILVSNPDATNLAVSNASGLARNTVRSRLARFTEEDILRSFERRIDPSFLGFPLRAYVITRVTQRKLDQVSHVLATVPEVLEVHGLAGVSDLLVQCRGSRRR